MVGGLAITQPAAAADQAVGVKQADLPDLTIKESRVYVIKSGQSGGEVDDGDRQIASIVTKCGIEGNYTLATRYPHPNWSNLGWLEYVKSVLPGKSVLDFPAHCSQWPPHPAPGRDRVPTLRPIDNRLWDILGKAVGLPVYRILGAYRHRVLAYASSQHLKTVDAFVADVERAKAEGFRAYKIHPPFLEGGEVDFKLDMEVARAVRKTAGDDFPLLFDRVGTYTRYEAMEVGRLLDYVALCRLRRPATPQAT